MSVFTALEITDLTSRTLGRLATVRAPGQPHVVPATVSLPHGLSGCVRPPSEGPRRQA